jgi:hypothetical protein
MQPIIRNLKYQKLTRVVIDQKIRKIWGTIVEAGRVDWRHEVIVDVVIASKH